jgi:membrane protein YdbS with pleckstrin-like domain
MMRNWRLRAWWGAGLAVVSAVGVAACWYYQARGFWWCLSILGVASALISVFADINAYHDTKKRVAETEENAS